MRTAGLKCLPAGPLGTDQLDLVRTWILQGPANSSPNSSRTFSKKVLVWGCSAFRTSDARIARTGAPIQVLETGEEEG